ncbi:MAG: iron ABC transporter permease [Anaerolineae bacterium]|nr:iron ABC transporter permease [Anaerolineales bacterium]MCQ3972890.1 iron ABC transporter permease [Anaerolineae bacterium]
MSPSLPTPYSLLPTTFLLLFYFYPLFSILSLSFAPAGQWGWTALQTLVSTGYYAKTLWFTLWQAFLSTLLTLGLALPAAHIFARYHFPGKSLLQALTTIPFVLPTIVVANAFTALLGPRGVINEALLALFRFTIYDLRFTIYDLPLDSPPLQLQHSLGMILLAHVFYNYTIVLRLVSSFWANLDPRLMEAGQMLGISPRQALRQITLPLLLPAVLAAALLVFIFCFTSFGVILILGGPRFATLEVEIYRQAVNLFNLPVAAALSLLQIVFIFALMLIYTRLQARTTHPLNLQSQRATQRAPQSWRERLWVGGNIGLMVLLLGTPLAALVWRSLTVAGQLSLNYYHMLISGAPQNQSLFFVPPGEAIANSLTFALATVILAILLGLLAAVALTRNPKFKTPSSFILHPSSFLDAFFMLPLATSAVTLGFGYIITFDTPPLNLRTSPLLIVIAHTLVALPFVIRSLLPALRSIQPALREAAAVLGASPLRVWREIDLPIASRALLVGAVFAFTISMGEFGATVFIARPNTPTMPIAIFRFLDQPGMLNYGQALAMSTLLMLVCAIGFVVIERFRIGGEF